MFAESLTPLMRPAKQVKLSPVPVTKVDETVFDAPPYEPGEGEEGDDSFLILHDGGRSMSDERSASSSSIHQEEEPVAEAHQEEQEQHENQENQGQQYDNWFEEMEQKYGMLSDVELSAVIQGAIDFLKACAVTKPETDKITDYMNLLQSIAKFAQGAANAPLYTKISRRLLEAESQIDKVDQELETRKEAVKGHLEALGMGGEKM